MKIITIPETSIRIGVETAEEMYLIFFRLHPVHDLVVDGELYPCDTHTGYTRGYFKKMFERG